MKVIDLLNKIANGEEVPKKIKVGNSAFKLSLVELNGSKHYSGNTESVLNNVLGMAKLNEEVEIIEEYKPKILNNIRESYGLPRIEDKKIENKIEKLDCDIDFDDNVSINGKCLYDNALLEIGNKINEIIEVLNNKENK